MFTLSIIIAVAFVAGIFYGLIDTIIRIVKEYKS